MDCCRRRARPHSCTRSTNVVLDRHTSAGTLELPNFMRRTTISFRRPSRRLPSPSGILRPDFTWLCWLVHLFNLRTTLLQPRPRGRPPLRRGSQVGHFQPFSFSNSEPGPVYRSEGLEKGYESNTLCFCAMGASGRPVRVESSTSDELFTLRLLVPLRPLTVQHSYLVASIFRRRPAPKTLLPTVAFRGTRHRQRCAGHISAAYTRIGLVRRYHGSAHSCLPAQPGDGRLTLSDLVPQACLVRRSSPAVSLSRGSRRGRRRTSPISRYDHSSRCPRPDISSVCVPSDGEMVTRRLNGTQREGAIEQLPVAPGPPGSSRHGSRVPALSVLSVPARRRVTAVRAGMGALGHASIGWSRTLEARPFVPSSQARAAENGFPLPSITSCVSTSLDHY
ncbi:hypothetical protein C8Q76DRAFT_242840 [Earliella scabrosa]|nr:hypothetical protein C8Q76DRAFT_242840 [Earliella scabrosa]